MDNNLKSNTAAEFKAAISLCRDIFAKKLQDYGTSWRVMRPSSLTDQIYIKAKRIRNLEMLVARGVHAWAPFSISQNI